MVTRTEAFPSKFLKPGDLVKGPVVFTIRSVEMADMKTPDGKQQRKLTLGFQGTGKIFPINLTNWDSIAEALGEEDSDAWVGRDVELFASTVIVGNESKACIRARAPSGANGKLPAAVTAVPPKRDDMDDEIPF